MLVSLLVIAAVARLYKLDSQLWLDEISALRSIRRPLSEILTTWPGFSSHVFFEIWPHLTFVAFGEVPFAVRLPAAVFGVLGVWLIYVLCSQTFGQRESLVVTGLFALSYHHVFFSQNARGYTLVMVLFLATMVVADAMARGSRPFWQLVLAYSVAGALSAYTMPFGAFVAAGHFFVAGLLLALQRARGPDRLPSARALLYGTMGAGLLATILYVPFLADLTSFAREVGPSAGAGPRVGVGLLFETIDGLQAAFFGPVGLAVATSIGVVGLVAWARSAPVTLGMLYAPLILQALTLGLLGYGLHPRYFAIALPVVYLTGGVGLARVVSFFGDRLPVGSAIRAPVAGAALAVLTIASAFPLLGYYSVPKQDHLGAIVRVRALASPGDVIAGVHLAEHVINGYYGAGFTAVEVEADLLDLERRAETTIWLVTTLEGLLRIHDPGLFDHIRARYERVEVLPGSVGGANMYIYAR